MCPLVILHYYRKTVVIYYSIFCTRHQRFTATGDATAPADIMFIKNANPRRHNRHYELFLPSRPYRGEPPTVAGKALLLFCPSISVLK